MGDTAGLVKWKLVARAGLSKMSGCGNNEDGTEQPGRSHVNCLTCDFDAGLSAHLKASAECAAKEFHGLPQICLASIIVSKGKLGVH